MRRARDRRKNFIQVRGSGETENKDQDRRLLIENQRARPQEGDDHRLKNGLQRKKRPEVNTIIN